MSDINKVEGYLYYICLQKPVPCVDEEKGKEYKVSVVVARDFAEEYEEAFTKVSLKKVRTADFEGQYKTEPPEEFAGEKFQYIITLRKNTLLGNGEPVPTVYLPKVLIKKGSKLVDVTQETLVGNGSKGVVSLDIYSTDKGKYPGTYPRLKNVLVTELVEYERPEGNYDPNVDPVFGEFESDAVPTDKEFSSKKEEPKETQKPAPKASAGKAKAKPSKTDDDTDSPF